MNRVNKPARARTAVDILNATLLIIRLEEKHLEKYKALAWARKDQLTPRGMLIMDNAYKNVDIRAFEVDIRPDGNCYRCTVKSTLKASSKKFTVVIPMEEDEFGSRFGTCTCGKPAKEGIPCQHMVVVAKASAIDDLARIAIIPGCMTTAFWRKQYAQTVQCRTTSMSDIKTNHTPDDSLRCMPEVLAPNKTGRPKKNARCMGVMGHIASAGKRKRKKRLFCTNCQKFNHDTADCWRNKSKRQKKSDSSSNNDEQDEDEDLHVIPTNQKGVVKAAL